MRNLHFTYNLSLNEQNTLDNLNKFIKKNFGGKDGLAVPIKFDIKNAITQQDIQSIQRQLDTQYANKLSLTANLKVNKSDIQTQAQTALDQASKNLKIKVGAELDLGAIEGIAELSSMVDTITSEVSRLKQNMGSIGKDLGIDLNAQQTERQLDAMLEKSERMIKASEQSLQITAKELEQTKEKLNSLKEISKEKKRAMDEEEAKFKEIAKVTSDEDKQRTARIVKLEKETEELRKQAKLEKEKAQTIKETNDKAKKAEKEQKDLTSSINGKSNEISELKEKKDLTSKVVEEVEKEKKIQQERLSSINEEIKALRERIKLQAQVEDTIDKTEVKTTKPATKKEAKEVENKINEDVKKQTEEQNKSLKEQANLVEYIGRAKDKNYKHELTTKRDALYIGIQENEATKVLHDLTIQGVKDRKTIIELENKYGQELAQSRGLVEKVNELIAKGSDLTEEETDKLKEYLVQLKQELVLFDKLKGARETNERKKVYEALEKAETKNWGDDTLNKKADFQAEKAVKIGSAYVYKGILVDLINTIQNDIGVTAKADTETIKKQKELEQQREENKANRKTAQAIKQEKVALESNIRYPEAGSFITDKIKNASYEQLLEKLDDLADGTLSKLMKENLGGIDYEKVETVIKNNEKKIKSLEQLIEETTDENIVKGYTQQLDKLNKNMENLKKLTNTYEEIDSMLRIMENSMSSNNSESLLGMLSEEGNVSVTKDQLKEYQQRIKDFMTWGVRGGGFTDLDNNTKSNMTWIEKDMSKLSANPDATINDWELLMDKLKGYQEQLGVTENDVASFVKKLRESSEAQREQKKAYAEQVAQGNEYEATLKRYLKLLDKESEEYKECRQALTEYTNARSQKLELGDQLLKMGEVIGRTSEVVKDAPEPISVKQTTKRKTADELINSMSETELQDIRHQNLLGNQFKLISQITDAQERFNAILKLTGMNYDDIYEKNLEIFKSISDNDKIKALKDSLNSGVEFGSELLSPNSYGKVDFSKLDLDNLNPNLDVTDLIASRRAIEEVVSSLTQLSSSIYGYGTTAESLARGVHEGLSEELTLKRAISVINDEHEKQDKQLIKLNEELHKLQSDPNANAFELKHIERKVSSTKELVDYYANAKNIAYERLIVIKDMKAHEESELANVNKVVDARKEELEVIKEATTLAKSKDAKDYAKATIDSLEKIKKSPTFKNKAKNNPALASELDELRKTAEIEKGSSKGIEYWEDYINKVKDFAINQANMKEKTLDNIINKQIMKEVPLVDSSEVKSLEEINELSKQQAKSIKQAVESKEEQVERTKEVSEAKEEEINTERELVEVINEQRENEEERNKIVLKANQEKNESLETMKERLAVLESQKAKEEEALKTSSKKLEEGQKELQNINDKLDKTTELKNAEEERLNALGKTVEVAKEDVEENERKLKSTEELLRAKEEELALLKQDNESDDAYGESLVNLERMRAEHESTQKTIEETEKEVKALTEAFNEQTKQLNKSVEEYNRLLGITDADEVSIQRNTSPTKPQEEDDSLDLKDDIALKQRDLDLELRKLTYNKELGESNQEIAKSIKEQISLMDGEVNSAKELDKYVANIKASLKEFKFEIDIEEDTRKRDEINKNTNYELLNMDELNEKLKEQIDLYQRIEAKKMALYMMRNQDDLDTDIVGNLLKQIDELGKSTQTFAEFEERIKRIGQTFEELKIQTDYNKETRKRAEAMQAEAEAREKEAQKMEEYDRRLKAHIATKEAEARQQIRSALNSKTMVNATEEQRQALRNLSETLNLNADSIQEVNALYKEFQTTLKGIKIEATTTQLANQRSIFGKLASEVKDYTMRYLDLGEAFQQVGQVFRDAFEHTKVIDEAFTNINQTMATTEKQFQSMIDQAYETGNATGQLATEVMEMMKVYASAGETAESINAKLTGTSAFQNVTGLDGTTATNSIQTIIEQFGLAKDGAMSYAEAINYLGDALVGVGYNLSKDETIAINEVVSAVEDAGSVIHQAGGSLEWYASITGTLAEQMNATGSEVGGAMRMITARTLQQKQVLEEYNDTGEDTAIAMANAEKALKSIGVTIRDSGGDLRTIEEVLGDVASKWDTLSDSSQQFVSEKLAGTNRRAYFVGIMENYQRVLELQKQAENSQGAMMKASEIQAESLSGKLNTLTNSMTLFYESILTSDTAKGIVEFGTTAIDSLRVVVEFMEGKWMTAISGVVTSLATFEVAKRSITAGGFIAWLKNAVKAVLGFEQGVRLATVGTVAWRSALAGIGASIVVYAISKVAEHIKNVKESIENVSSTTEEMKDNLKSIEATSKLVDDYRKANKELEVMLVGTDEYITKQNEINSLKEQLMGYSPEYKTLLENETLELEKQYNIMKNMLNLESREEVQQAVDALPEVGTGMEGKRLRDISGNLPNMNSLLQDFMKAKEDYERLVVEQANVPVDKMAEYKVALEQAKDKMDESEQSFIDAMSPLSDSLSWVENYNEVIEKGMKTFANLDGRTLIELPEGATEQYQEMVNLYYELKGLAEDTTDSTKEQASILESMTNLPVLGTYSTDNLNTEGLKQLLAELKDVEIEGGDADKTLKLLKSTFDDMPDDVDSLADAMDYLNQKLAETSENAGNSAEDMKDVNKTYLEALEQAREARELLESFKDGLDLDEKLTIFDSDVMSGYKGSIEDSASIQEHLNKKIKEMETVSNQAYAQMMANDKTFWNEKMKNSQEWASFEAGLQQNVTQLGAEMLGIQEQDFAKYIDSKGGMRAIDLSNAETMNEAEGTVNMGMLNQMMGWYEDYVNEKGGSRKVDMTNVIEFLNTQGKNEVLTINQLAQKWSEFYNNKKKAIQANARELSTLMNSQLSKLEASNFPVYDKYDMGYYDAKTNEVFGTLSKDVKALQDASNAMKNYFEGTSYTFDKISDTVKQNSADFDKLTKPTSSGSGSGSGNKDKNSSEKDVDNLELEIDRYYELNDAIKDLENALSSLQAKREQITTKADYKKSIEEEIALVNKQITAYQNLLKEQQKERNEIKSTLSKNGFKFDGDGDISNYATQLKKLQDSANKKTGEAKEQAIAQVEALADLIKKYDELHNDAIPSTNVEIISLQNEIANLNKDLEENMKAIEALGDRYFNLSRKMAKVDNAIALNQLLQEVAVGQRKLDLMKEEQELLKEKQKITKEQLAESKKESDELAKQLKDKGVTFNADGSIKNYDELVKKLTEQADKLVGDAQSDAIEDAEDILDLIDKYVTLTEETIPDLNESWQEYANNIASIENEMKQVAVDAQKDVASAYEHYLTKRYNKVKEMLQKEKDAYNDAYEEESFDRNLKKEQQALDEIAQQIAIYSRDTSEAGKARLEQLKKEYEEQQEAINDMIRENEKNLMNDRFDEEQEKLDEELEDLLSPENLVKVVNEAISSGMITLGDEVISLNELMTNWIDETGDGLYALGDSIKNDLIGNLQMAKSVLDDMGFKGSVNIPSLASALGEFRGGSTSNVSFNAPLLQVEGNVDKNVFEDLQSEMKKLENSIIDKIAKSMK